MNLNPTVNIYHSLSRACFQSNAAQLQELLENNTTGNNVHPVDININERAYSGIPLILDDSYLSSSPAQSLMVLAVKYSDRRVTRLLLEQGVDVETEDLYVASLRGQWRDDWSEKAEMLVEAASISTSDPHKLLKDYRLYYLPRILELLEFLKESGNWFCFQNLLRVCYEQHLRLLPGEICDNDKKLMQQMLIKYNWLLNADKQECFK
jgi:hypothetical protein